MNLEKYEIVYVTRESSNLAGARYRAYNFCKKLKELGYNCRVISYAEDLGALSGNLEQFLNLSSKINYNIKAYKTFAKLKNPFFIIQRFNYHSLAVLLFCMKHGIKYAYDLDDWEFRENVDYIFSVLPRSKAEFIFRKTAARAAFCIAGSTFLYDYLKKINPKTAYLAPGIDLEMFKPAKPKEDKPLSAVWVGTMFKEEDYLNLKFLFEILKFFPSLNVEIIGSGIYKEKISKQLKTLNLNNVNIKGWINHNSLAEYLDSFEIGFLPIAVENNFMKAKFPIKVIEMMAKEIVVAASCYGEVKQIIRHGQTGMLAKNSDEFKNNLTDIINNKNKRQQISRKSRNDIMERYDLNKQTAALVEIIKDML